MRGLVQTFETPKTAFMLTVAEIFIASYLVDRDTE